MTAPVWRVRASLLDSLYWHWRTGADDEKLRARIAQTQPENAAMRRGTAIHKALEEHNPFDRWQSPEFVVAFDDDDPGDLPLGVDRLPFPHGADRREVTVQRQFGDVLFTGHVDLLGDGFIVDYKTSTRKPRWSNHADSWQWRAYCLICDVDRALYRHYQYKAPRKRTKPVRLDVMLPEDYDFYLDAASDDLLDVGRAIVTQAERLDCAGAVMQDRHLAIRNLIHARNQAAPAGRGKRIKATAQLVMDDLRKNKPDWGRVKMWAKLLAGMALSTERPLLIALKEIEGLLRQHHGEPS